METGATEVTAAQAYACLTSVALDRRAAIAWVDSIRPYLEWQSDPTYKANPPADYDFAGHDFFKAIDNVRSKLTSGQYANEYEFQADLLSSVYLPGHDGHMYLYPDLLARASTFVRGADQALVSVSDDGSATPSIKFYSDVANNPKTASVVTKINGVDASTYLLNYVIKTSSSQTKDASYNLMFYQRAQAAFNSPWGYHVSGGRGALLYQGANTTYTFKNGTTRTFENRAKLRGDFTGVVDGPSFYKKFCTPRTPPNAAPVSKPPMTNVPGYPAPVVLTHDGIVSGYYLDGDKYADTAVLSLLAFQSASMAEFQDVITQFFAKARRDGKTKLIIDLQANGGGLVLHGFDLFRQLFPSIVEENQSRFRAGKIVLDVAHELSDDYTRNRTDIGATIPFAWQNDYDVDWQRFPDYESKFGPFNVYHNPYTALMRYDFQSNDWGFNVTGYGNRTGFTQPFEAENVVLLYDGYCASTCTIASQLLKDQTGIKSVAIGGLPNKNPMQGVGGIKGSNDYELEYINLLVEASKNLSSNPRHIADFNRYTPLAFERAYASALNVRDQIRTVDIDSGLPAQYAHEDSDCRLFWTTPMLSDITSVWKATHDAAFDNGRCVNGGISHRRRRATHAADKYTAPVPDLTQQGSPLLKGSYPADNHDIKFRNELIPQVFRLD